MTDTRYAISFCEMPYGDHRLTLDRLFTLDVKQGTKRSYFYSYRFAMGAIVQEAPHLLKLPFCERVFEGAEIIASNFAACLRPIDTLKELRQFQRVASILCDKEITCFEEAKAEISFLIQVCDQGDRLRSESKAVDLDAKLPHRYDDMLINLQESRTEAGSPLAPDSIESGRRCLALFLGLLDREGVNWRMMRPEALLTSGNMSLLRDAWCSGTSPWTQSQRVNELGCFLKHMLPKCDVSIVFRTAAEVRATNPKGNDARGFKKSIDVDEVPDEDLARFAFACPREAERRNLKFRYGKNAQSFEFQGRRIRLERNYETRPATELALFATLRAMITVLKLSSPDEVDQPTEKRDYDHVVKLFEIYYSDNQPSTLLNRLENLKMLLMRTLSKGTRIAKLDESIRKAKASMERDDVVVPEIFPTSITQVALRDLSIASEKFRDLRFFEEVEEKYGLKRGSTIYTRASEFAELIRDLLMIALLAHNPLRLRSIQTLELNDLKTVSYDDKQLHKISIPGERTKTGEPISFYIPRALEPWLFEYLNVVRGCIAPKYTGNAFWVSKENKELSRGAIGKRIPEIMAAAHGVRVNVHLFRHIVGTAEYDAGGEDNSLSNSSAVREKFYVDSRKKANGSKSTCLADDFDEALGFLGIE